MIPGPYVVGMDIGTGSAKAVAFSPQGHALASAQHYYSTQHSQPGYSEQDPEAVWEAFCNALLDLLAQLQQPPGAVVLSSAMHSLLVMDEMNQPLTPLILWSDNRSAAIAQELKDAPEGMAIYQATGTPVHAMSPLCKIIWLRQNQPAVFAAARKFISIKEYIWFRLFGVFEIDDSIASATGLFNGAQLSWHTPALDHCGITAEQLPTPVRTHHSRKQIMPAALKKLQLQDIPFFIGASDGCLANLGTFATGAGTAAVTIGTSGAVRICTQQPITDPDTMLFLYRLDEQTFVCGGPVSNGGNILQWLLQHFLKIETPQKEDYDALFRQAGAVAPGSEGLLFLPYLHGERAPVWDAASSGAFFGIRAGHRQQHFIRAAFEGVCFALQEVLLLLEKANGPVQQLNVSGGFIHAPFWMQLLADVTGKKLCLLQEEDASAAGAAYLGLKQLGWIDDYRSLLPAQLKFIEPNPTLHPLYRKYFAVYKSLYPSLKEAMHALENVNRESSIVNRES